MKAIDHCYERQPEPAKSCLLALREMILAQDPAVTEALKYGMPFFCYRDRMFCYLWLQKKTGTPYIGVVEGGRIDHPALIQEKRSRMKIMLIDPEKDIPAGTLTDVLQQALDFYRSGMIKTKR